LRFPAAGKTVVREARRRAMSRGPKAVALDLTEAERAELRAAERKSLMKRPGSPAVAARNRSAA
jgi:hypothetical protein